MQGKIKLDLSVSHKYIRQDLKQKVYLLLQIKQPKVEMDTGRRPINVSFVLDRSGSMAGEKLAYTKKAVSFALEHLDSRDRVSVVTFDDDVQVLIPPQTTLHKDQMIQDLQAIYPGGCTNLSGGLFKGVALVKGDYDPEWINRVILLTDGLANVGITEPHKLVAKVKEIQSKNISLSTLGVGQDFQEDLLVDMAEAGGGNFYYIASPDMLPEIFKEELQGLLTVTAQNLELSVNPASPEVEVSGILGYQPTWEEGARVALPDMYSDSIKTILIELTAFPQKEGKLNLATVKFRYDDILDTLSTVDYSIDVSVEVAKDPSLVQSGIDLKVIKEVEIFETTVIKEEAIKEADSGNFQGARFLLRKQKEKLMELYSEINDDEIELLKRCQNKTLSEIQKMFNYNRSYNAIRFKCSQHNINISLRFFSCFK